MKSVNRSYNEIGSRSAIVMRNGREVVDSDEIALDDTVIAKSGERTRLLQIQN